jgi:hypothetical protein
MRIPRRPFARGGRDGRRAGHCCLRYPVLTESPIADCVRRISTPHSRGPASSGMKDVNSPKPTEFRQPLAETRNGKVAERIVGMPDRESQRSRSLLRDREWSSRSMFVDVRRSPSEAMLKSDQLDQSRSQGLRMSNWSLQPTILARRGGIGRATYPDPGSQPVATVTASPGRGPVLRQAGCAPRAPFHPCRISWAFRALRTPSFDPVLLRSTCRPPTRRLGWIAAAVPGQLVGSNRQLLDTAGPG